MMSARSYGAVLIVLCAQIPGIWQHNLRGLQSGSIFMEDAILKEAFEPQSYEKTLQSMHAGLDILFPKDTYDAGEAGYRKAKDELSRLVAIIVIEEREKLFLESEERQGRKVEQVASQCACPSSPAGYPGPRGPAGVNGWEGEPGQHGIPGSDGNFGPPGTPGALGTPGTNGVPGSPGPPGPPGLPGQAGTPGSHGVAGTAGSFGTRGPSGTPGSAGGSGLSGPVGQSGLAGPNGRNGIPGSSGPNGPVGPAGPAGTSGSVGTPGNPGSGGPSGGFGAPGQAGVAGVPGVPGTGGTMGASGSQGQNGPDGHDGKAGQDGSAGQAGVPGPQGATGVPGSPGPLGTAGTAGQAAQNGIGGLPGQPGRNGDDGGKGPNGPPGTPGTPGAQGLNGVPGFPGFPGNLVVLPNKVDGVWSGWGLWSECQFDADDCGNGMQERTRACNDPPPSHGGDSCAGDGVESQMCNVPCPINGGLADWSEWSSCVHNTGTCGLGLETRTRTCTNPSPDFGGMSCPDADPNSESRTCFTDCPVDGGFGEYGDFGACIPRAFGCGDGTKTQSRLCDNPVPQFEGAECMGAFTQSDDCVETCTGTTQFKLLKPTNAAGINVNGVTVTVTDKNAGSGFEMEFTADPTGVIELMHSGLQTVLVKVEKDGISPYTVELTLDPSGGMFLLPVIEMLNAGETAVTLTWTEKIMDMNMDSFQNDCMCKIGFDMDPNCMQGTTTISREKGGGGASTVGGETEYIKYSGPFDPALTHTIVVDMTIGNTADFALSMATVFVIRDGMGSLYAIPPNPDSETIWKVGILTPADGSFVPENTSPYIVDKPCT